MNLELELSKVIIAKGGECLSVSQNVKGVSICSLRCREGHAWKAQVKRVLSGGWCPKCESKEATANLIHARIAKQGWKAVTAFKDRWEFMRIRCEKGHEFNRRALHLLENRGCTACIMEKRRIPLSKFQQYAKSRGGRCLSTIRARQEDPVEMECRNGHRWMFTRQSLYSKAWCARCAPNARLTLDALDAYAAARGGRCVTRILTNPRKKIFWKCKVGHDWLAAPKVMLGNQSWCPKCVHDAKKAGIESMHKIAKKRGGRCLSTKYVSNKTALRWRCSKGHEWSAKPNYITSSETWCPVCANQRPLQFTTRDMQDLAENKNGHFASAAFEGMAVRHKWKCALGHRWSATPASIKRGSWCRECSYVERGLRRKSSQGTRANQT